MAKSTSTNPGLGRSKLLQELQLPEDVAHLARKATELSPDDRAELGRFADFLRTKNSVEED